MILASIFQKFIVNYSIDDTVLNDELEEVTIYLSRNKDMTSFCTRCGEELQQSNGGYYLKSKTMPVFGLTTYFHFYRERRWCPCCKKFRSEHVEFLSEETPHITKDFSY